MQGAALAVATAPSVNISVHSFTSPLGTGKSPSLCYQATKTAPALGGEQTNQDSQGRSFTWLASVMERELSGFTQEIRNLPF